jgi:hypothetical protein
MIEYLNHNSGALTVIFTAVVTISTVVYAVLTATLVSETRKMRQAQTEPKIEITVKSKEEWINLIRLHIKNIGLGPAYDISFSVQPEFEQDGSRAIINDFTKANFFNTGLKYLGPGQEIVGGYTQMVGALFDLKIESILIFNIQYKDATGKLFNEAFRVSFSEFKGRSQLGTPHLYKIAQSLEHIDKNIDHIATGWKKLKMDIYDRTDREKEQKELEDYYKEQTKNANTSENDSEQSHPADPE